MRPAEGDHLALAAHLGPDDEEQHGEGRDLDAARGEALPPPMNIRMSVTRSESGPIWA